MGSVTHWDLGTPAPGVALQVTRRRIDPGGRWTSAHPADGAEEIVFVLAGHARSQADAEVAVGPGDCLVHLAGAEAFTLLAGEQGLEVLVFGERAGTPAAASPPGDVVSLSGLEAKATRRGRTDVVRRDLGRAAGSVRTGMSHVVIHPGAESHPPHVHSAEEELFVVLDGSGTVLLGDESLPVRAGSVITRPAGSKVAHSFAAGDDGLTLLAYGQRDPSDLCWYPRSRKLSVRAFGLIFRVEESLGYWDGEE